MKCATPACGEHAGHGLFDNFCAEHAERLAAVRVTLIAEREQRTHKARSGRAATCCNPFCFNTRVPPASFCDECQHAGYVEEIA